MKMTLTDYKKYVKKCNTHKKMEISNSYGVRDYMLFYHKNKPKGYTVNPKEYYAIIRRTGQLIAEKLAKGQYIDLPYSMGRLTIRKFNSKIKLEDGKVITNLPVDWNRTLELWYDDEQSRNEKRLVRCEGLLRYNLIYIRILAAYKNKAYYEFKFNRFLKKKLKDNIRNGEVHALNFPDKKINEFYGR